MTRLALVTAAVCAVALLPATAAQAGDDTGGTTFRVNLTGSEIPGGGDPNGSGLAVLTLDPNDNELCWDINWKGLSGQVTAIHLHKGPPGGTGPHAVDLLDGASFDGTSGQADSCTTPHNHAMGEGMAKPGGGGHSIVDAHTEPGGGNVLNDVIADPDDYYVNVHTTAYDKGAIRGQLG